MNGRIDEARHTAEPMDGPTFSRFLAKGIYSRAWIFWTCAAWFSAGVLIGSMAMIGARLWQF